MASTSALCRAWDMCHFLYLTPMTPDEILKRIAPHLKPNSIWTTFKRFRNLMNEIKIELKEFTEDKTGGGGEVRYYIFDPFWRDRLENHFGIDITAPL